MSENLATLRGLSDEELIKKHDELATSTQVGVNHYLQEIARRDQDKQTRAMLAYTKSMLAYTKWIKILTVAIMIFTIVNVAVTIFLIMKQNP